MKNFIPIMLFCATTLLFSCSTSYYTSSGYENDDVYYVPGDAERPQYSEYSTEKEAETEDDYYSEEAQQDDYYNENNQGLDQRGHSNTYNNYNYYRYQQSPFARYGYYDPVYSSPWYNGINFRSTFGSPFGYNSYSRWSIGYSWGYGSTWMGGYNNFGPYNPYTPWWNPYDPFYAGTYYSPYYSGYYGHGYGYGGYHDFYGRGSTGRHYGHRTPITSNSDLNSNYRGGSIYAVRESAKNKRLAESKGNVPSAHRARVADNEVRRADLRRVEGLNNQQRENRETTRDRNRTDYYQWRGSDDNLERRRESDNNRQPDPNTRRPERERQPDYRQPDRQREATPNNRPERQGQQDYRQRDNSSSSPGFLDFFMNDGNNKSRSRDSRPSTRPNRGNNNNRPSYNQPSRRSGGSVTPNRGSGSSGGSRGSSGGSRSRGGGR